MPRRGTPGMPPATTQSTSLARAVGRMETTDRAIVATGAAETRVFIEPHRPADRSWPAEVCPVQELRSPLIGYRRRRAARAASPRTPSKTAGSGPGIPLPLPPVLLWLDDSVEGSWTVTRTPFELTLEGSPR